MKTINEQNKYYLDNYRFILQNRGLTKRSINAICDSDLKLFLRWLESKSFLEVTHIDVQKFLMHCGTLRKNGAKALNRKHTNINMFYKRLIINLDLNIKNPVSKVDKPKIRKTVRPYLNKAEYNQFLDYLISKNDLRGIALSKLFYSSSCRLSEIWQLDISSLDFTNRRFVVTGKGEKERNCMFSEDAAIAIKNYLRTRKDNNKALFISKYETRLSRKAIQDFFRTNGERAEIEKRVHPHLFRHTRAMHLLQDGVKLETIQRLLGHESIATTQIYAHMNFNNVQSEIDNIDCQVIDKIAA